MTAGNIISPLFQNCLKIKVIIIYTFLLILTVLSAYFTGITAAFFLLIIWTVLFFLISSFYIPALCSSEYCSLQSKGIFIKRGLFFKSSVFIDYSSIEYCILIITPSDRLYGLCTLIILCEGSREAIHGLKLHTGERIISKKRRRDNEA